MHAISTSGVEASALPHQASEAEEDAAKRGRPPCEPADVLVVDDTPENLMSMEAVLAQIGCRIVTARSGREALRHLLTQDFAVILLDVQMPTMSGIETARMIRARGRSEHTPIIFITAHQSEDAEIAEAYRLNAVDFLFKPVHLEVLRAKVAVFVELHRRTQEIARQAELLREHERAAHARELSEQRQHLEREALRQRLEEQQHYNGQLLGKTEALAKAVAELERTKAELETSNQKLAEADRRKDEFLATLAHELRNPLAPIVAGLEVLNMETAKPALHAHARTAIRRQTNHLVRLVDDLLDVSRITSGKIELRREALDLREVARQAVAMSRPLIEERAHALQVEVGEEMLPVYGDAVRLTQVVANLLNNAARYTLREGQIQLACAREDDEVVLRVRDNGQGIAVEMLERVFDMFVQQRTGGSGLGVGLSLVRNLVEMHGGRVRAHSDGPGLGSRFEIRLPAHVSAGEAVYPDKDRLGAHAARSLRIVVIDDHDDIRLTMHQMLESWGHHVQVASTGQEGAALVIRERPDVALVDIGLPDILGYDVARRIRAAIPAGGPRLVALTGFNQGKDRARAHASGFDRHLAKPASGADLERVLFED